MAYYVGDIPVEDIVIEPARNGEPIDLTNFNAADSAVDVRDPAGLLVSAEFFVDFTEEGEVMIEWPSHTIFETPGIYSLAVILSNGVDALERLAPVYIVAQLVDGWMTVDGAREVWRDAPSDDARLAQILDLAKQQVLAYAPTLAADAPVPANYREGQLMQSRNLWNAGRVDPSSGGIGEEDFVIRPFPLDWMVKQVLRPASGKPVVR
jgi:hypothetical protein